jgi:hypothetical protein
MSRSNYLFFPKPCLSVLLLLIAFISQCLLSFPGCKLHEDDGSGNGGGDDHTCVIFNFYSEPSEDPISINAGGSQSVTITATLVQDQAENAGFDCDDIASSFTTVITGSNPFGLTTTGGDGTMTNNQGTATLTIHAPEGTPIGFSEIMLLCTATLQDGRTFEDTELLGINISEAGFQLTIPQTLIIMQGLTLGPVPVMIERTGGHEGDIDLWLENLPADVDFSFAPDPVPYPETSSNLTLTAEITAPASENAYNVKVTGSDGTMQDTAIFSLFVNEPFTVNFYSDTAIIKKGEEGYVYMSLEKSGMWEEPISMNIAGGIIGTGADKVGAVFDPNPVIFSQVTLTLTVGTEVEAGTYALEVTASSLGLVKSGTLVLDVPEL